MIKEIKFEDFDIDKRSKTVAKKYGLEVKRVKAMYSKLTKFLGKNLNLIGLELAFMYNKPSKALALLEKEDVIDFAKRVNLVRYFFSDYTPNYTLEMLTELIEDYISYLNQNRSYLFKIGYPRKVFEGSEWIDSFLSLLYPIKKAVEIWYLPTGKIELPIKKAQRPRVYHTEKEEPELYEKGPILDFLNEEEADRLKTGRSKFFELKISILNVLVKALKCKTATKLWDDCLSLITEAITAKEVDFYLSIDRRYSGVDLRAGERPLLGLKFIQQHKDVLRR